MFAGTDKLVPVAGAGGVGMSTYQLWLTQPGNAGKTIGQFLAAQTGPTGPACTLTIGTVTTGAPGSQASAAVTGQAPNQVLSLTLPQGAAGPANTLGIGTVATGAPGSPAAASITGAAPNQTLNLTLPQGQAGPANTLGIGTVTTGVPGSSASATITGAAPNQSLSLTIPQGATGVAPWQTPPQPWAASTAYTATAPASSVTYGGESYVCSTTHNSGAAFDASKWIRVAARGADGAPAAGAVLYSQAQGLAPADRGTAKGNLRVLGWAYAYMGGGASIALAPTDVGTWVYSDGVNTATLPRSDQVEEGAQFALYVNSGTLTLNIATGDPNAYIAQAAGPYSVPVALLPGAYLVSRSVNGWRFLSISPPLSSLLLNDRAQTPTDAQRALWLSNLGMFPISVRQTVLSGPRDGNGLPSIFPATASGLSITTQNVSSSNPLVVTAAGGFGVNGARDKVAALTTNTTTSLFASATNYIYIDLDNPSSIFVWGAPPVYQWAGAPATTQYVYTFIISEMQGYLGNGTVANKVNWVFLDEVTTNATDVISTVAYAYRGRYRSGIVPFSGTGAITFNHNIGVPAEQIRGKGYAANSNTGPWLADPLAYNTGAFPLFGLFGAVPRLATRAVPGTNGVFIDSGTNGGNTVTSGYLQYTAERAW